MPNHEPPFDGSPPCPMCPTEMRNLHAVAHNLLNRWDEVVSHGSNESWAHFRAKMGDLKRAVEQVQPLADAHFANEPHAFGRVRKPDDA